MKETTSRARIIGQVNEIVSGPGDGLRFAVILIPSPLCDHENFHWQVGMNRDQTRYEWSCACKDCGAPLPIYGMNP